MEYHSLGRTGVKISALAFGTMPFGSLADDETSSALFRRCREAGINTFDCADVYSKGKAEKLLGRFIAGCRDEVVIASKAYFPTGDDVNARGASRLHLKAAVEASLTRLNTDRIDLFFLHRFDELTAPEETWRAIDDLVRAGKILYPAMSNFAAWQAMKAVGLCEARGWARPVCVQPMYNLVKRQAEVEILPMAQAEEVAVLSYSPMGGGLLSGKYGRERRPDKGRLVDNSMYKTRYGEDDYYRAAEEFCALAEREGHHPAALAIAWVARHPAITAPIIGARSLSQLEPLLAAADLTMSDALYAEISALFPAPAPATDRNEEATRHNYGSR